MRRTACLAALATAAFALTACGAATSPSIPELAGPTNMAALDAAVACERAAGLQLARSEATDELPQRRLFSAYAEAAILTDMGQTDQAESVLATAGADPALNPNGASAAAFAVPSQALLQAIQERRMEASGSSAC